PAAAGIDDQLLAAGENLLDGFQIQARLRRSRGGLVGLLGLHEARGIACGAIHPSKRIALGRAKVGLALAARERYLLVAIAFRDVDEAAALLARGSDFAECVHHFDGWMYVLELDSQHLDPGAVAVEAALQLGQRPLFNSTAASGQELVE